MVRFRRIVALSMLALCLQPLLPREAVGCGSHSSAVASADDGAMANMPMPMRTPEIASPSNRGDHDVPIQPHPCDGSTAPDACNAMGPCLSPPLAAVAVASTTHSGPDVMRSIAPLPLRAGHAAAPELPPPRA